MNIKQSLNIFVVLVSSFVFSGCSENSTDSSSSNTVDNDSHEVVYQDEIYKGWPYQ